MLNIYFQIEKKMTENKENNFFQELWEFIVNYESIIGNIKRWIIFLMHRFNNWWNNNYQECLQILISETESRKLINKYGALLFLFIPKENKYYNKIDELLKATEKLNELRNNLIHRHYMLWYEWKAWELVIDSLNQKSRKSWLNHNFLKITDIELKEINISIKKLNILFYWLENIAFREVITNFQETEISEIKKIKKIFEKFIK